MSSQAIAHLAFKMLGIYFILRAIEWLPGIAGWLAYRSNSTDPLRPDQLYLLVSSLVVCLLLIIFVVAGMVTIRNAHEWSVRMFPGDDSTPKDRVLGIHAFAYSVVGIYVGVNGITQLIEAVGILSDSPLMPRFLVLRLLPGLAGLSLGVGLFFGSHGLVRLWSRLRYSGLRRKMGLCFHCGYDMTGNTSGNCPECGTTQEATQ